MESVILKEMAQALLECDAEKTKNLAERALESNLEPLTIMDALVKSIRQVGEDFGNGTRFLPELVGAAEAMQNAMPIVEEAIKSKAMKRETLGSVVIGTVYGDIHTIGKAMVVALLTAEGFQVHDLGINVPAEKFMEAVNAFKPSILAMSALLTTTAPEAAKVIKQLTNAGIREDIKVMVGGGAITENFAKSIGADGYDSTAPGAVALAKKLLGL